MNLGTELMALGQLSMRFFYFLIIQLLPISRSLKSNHSRVFSQISVQLPEQGAGAEAEAPFQGPPLL